MELTYQKIGEYAKRKGVRINVISIIGEECNLEQLARLADMTGGYVDRVDPQNLTNNFEDILNEKLIASEVSL